MAHTRLRARLVDRRDDRVCGWYSLGSSWCRPPTEHSVRAMAMAGFHEVRHVWSEAAAKARSGVPAPAGRLHGTGGSCSEVQCAVGFRVHGAILGHVGGFGAEFEYPPETFQS